MSGGSFPLAGTPEQQAADPLHLFPNADNAMQPGAPTTLPNLGAASMIPQTPGGAFQSLNNGAGPYNAMAAAGAGGRTFNPGSMPQSGAFSPQPQGGSLKPSQSGTGAALSGNTLPMNSSMTSVRAP